MRVRRIIPMAVVAAILAVSLPATAGGSWMKTPDQWVEPGEEVELVAYVGASIADGQNADSQWIAYLNLVPIVDSENVEFQPLSLGPVTTDLTGLSGYLSHRVYLRFTVPADLVPGTYQVSVRRDLGLREEQSDFLGDLIGAHLAIGMPGGNSRYEWPLTEPLVAQLPDDALLSGPGWEITAGEARRGVIPTSTTVTSPVVTTAAVTTAAVTTGVTTNAVSIRVPTAVVPIQLPEAVEQPESPWFLIAGIAITVGCLAISSRVADGTARRYSTIETDPVVEPEPAGAVLAMSSTTGRN